MVFVKKRSQTTWFCLSSEKNKLWPSLAYFHWPYGECYLKEIQVEKRTRIELLKDLMSPTTTLTASGE